MLCISKNLYRNKSIREVVEEFSIVNEDEVLYEFNQLGIKSIKRLKSVTAKWQDGRITTHCTRLDPLYDYELIMRGDLYD